VRVKVRDVGHQAANVAGATDRLIDGDLVDDHLAEFLDQSLSAGLKLLDLLLQGVLQCHLLSPLLE
jgi:hypothetical protein